jgi:hypothetical protein
MGDATFNLKTTARALLADLRFQDQLEGSGPAVREVLDARMSALKANLPGSEVVYADCDSVMLSLPEGMGIEKVREVAASEFSEEQIKSVSLFAKKCYMKR